MNYYKASQYPEDHPKFAGKWVYTKNGYPYGASRKYIGDPDKLKPENIMKKEYETTVNDWEYIMFDNEEECLEAEKERIINEEVRHVTNSDQMRKCKVCEEWTQDYVVIDEVRVITLCKEHQTKEVISEQMGNFSGIKYASW